MNSSDAIFIAGGYGVVGSQLAEMIRQRYPDLPLILAGRNPDKAAELVGKLYLPANLGWSKTQRAGKL